MTKTELEAECYRLIKFRLTDPLTRDQNRLSVIADHVRSAEKKIAQLAAAEIAANRPLISNLET